jgi:hypothetical protein
MRLVELAKKDNYLGWVWLWWNDGVGWGE